jgi:hypothetical protein
MNFLLKTLWFEKSVFLLFIEEVGPMAHNSHTTYAYEEEASKTNAFLSFIDEVGSMVYNSSIA